MLIASAILLGACGGEDSTKETDRESAQKPFPSFNPDFKPPASEYDGELFTLSQDYPTEEPTGELPPFFQTDFKKDWRTYMMQVREYCFEGNTAVDWRVEKNKVRRWYHMPWQHYGGRGREAIHGITQEAPVAAQQLAVSQTYDEGQAYAVGFYNDRGGYTIGQVFSDHDNPNPRKAEDPGFPNGTVVCKTLFLDSPQDVVAKEIPSLANPILWKAYTADPVPPPKQPDPEVRSVKEVSLIQMDIMIRDERAPAGWIFGTFQYNGQLNEADPWENLVPVGLMWGNDPDVAKATPAPTPDPKWPPATGATPETPINPKLQETVINPDADELPATHLGWDGRLNGPVDNPRSSCMSCHMTASYDSEPLSPLFLPTSAANAEPGTPEWDTWWSQWFQNVGWKDGKLEAFMKAEVSVDFSLQMSAALQNFDQSVRNREPEHEVRR